MYLEHFSLTKFPFGLTPNTEFFCNLPSYQEALNILLFGINTGEGFIKVIGEVGSGKTILCRKFLNALDASYVTAYIPNPDLNPVELRRAFATELNIPIPSDTDQFTLLHLINEKLLDLRVTGKKVILIIDEAQALSDQSLEALRLLTNLETESEKLLQIVLFGQPELEQRLSQHHFRQLNQRITFAYYLTPLKRDDLDAYLTHRLSVAGYNRGHLFTRSARSQLFRASQGIPRVVNILCHKALLVSYGVGEGMVGVKSMSRAISDSRNVMQACPKKHAWGSIGMITLFLLIAALGIGFAYYQAGYFHF